MENFIVSARKYRPDTFDTVVGQDNITRTLKNAIKQNHLAQAYLFCGPRGVGKTTCARIFAKTINCENLNEDAEACNKCESCEAFNAQRSLNIHELDAASNNSVEDIRNLIDQVRIPPQIGQYSVYIIDEVHMLSSAAFNAFLKTLEEPPKHAIFILATTEKHKIIPTILSRCQVFDFNRIRIRDISERLEFVAQKEDITADKEALHVIAQKADGAMRDALSIFDQIVSFSGKEIKYQDALDNLNVLDYDYYFRITDAFLKTDHTEALLLFDEILNQGFDGKYFISGLAAHLRDILVCKDQKSTELLEVGDIVKEKYMKYATGCDTGFLIRALEIANECDYKYKGSQHKRLLVELALIRITRLTQVKPPEPVQKPGVSPEKKPPQVSDKQADYKAEKEKEDPPSRSPKAAPESESKEKTEKNQAEGTREKPQKPKPETQASIQGKPSTFSLSDIKKPSKPEAEVTSDKAEKSSAENTNLGNETLNDEKLKEAWETFIEQHKDHPRLYFNFKKNPPVIQSENQLLMSVPSKAFATTLKTIHAQVLSELRKILNNKDLSLEIQVDTKNKKEKRPYTEEEKYRYLVGKNPNLKTLRDRFDLNIS